MARIRTLKPEFPHSESMGHVSRDARLTFILMWTLADDSGRLRGNSRMLASLLFPYDDDAPGLIESWLTELEQQGCIVRYSADGTTCVQICNWLKHQKIDKPSASKLPPFDESSRIVANPLERSSEDQGSRTGIKDQGSKDQEGNAPRAKRSTATRLPDDFELTPERIAYAQEQRIDPQRTFQNFRDHWKSAGTANARKLDWDAAWRIWCRNEQKFTGGSTSRISTATPATNDQAAWAEARFLAKEIGFRDPHPGETVTAYARQAKESKDRPPTVPLAERRGLAGIKRIGALV
jgi:hypothetical protein